jgi:trimethylamine--corrinoid protein Co-methyltransferase
MLKGFVRNIRPLEILREEQVEEIHAATLDVLWETGIRIEHKKALKLLEKNGCKVDYDRMRVNFPAGLVEECLRRCPSSFRVKSRDTKNDLVVGANRTYMMTFPGMQAVDAATWEPRVATRKENYDGVTIIDALENVHSMSPYCPYFGFEGVPSLMGIPECLAANLRNSTKIAMCGYGNDCELYCIGMAKASGQEIIGMCLAAPPLTYFSEAIESLFRYVEAGLPILFGGGQVFGGTAPSTIAGATVTNNAELMAPVVLAQIIRPGTRVIAAEFAFPQNMKTGAPGFGSIGLSLHSAIFNQIWRKYEIPVADCNPGPSSSKRIDFQCSYEKTAAALTAALSGGNIIQFHGGLYGELSWHPLQAILDDDIAGMVGRLIQGVMVDQDTIALDLIEQVGPVPGHYLKTKHTREWWKKEQFIPKAADTMTYPEWMATGKKSCIDYAREIMEDILAVHKVSIPLTPGQEDEIEKTLKEAREYYRRKGLISDDEWETYRREVLQLSDSVSV